MSTQPVMDGDVSTAPSSKEVVNWSRLNSVACSARSPIISVSSAGTRDSDAGLSSNTTNATPTAVVSNIQAASSPNFHCSQAAEIPHRMNSVRGLS